MILKENKKFRKMFIVTEYAALIKQVRKCLKSDDQIRREHRRSRFEIEEQGNTEIHFIGTSGRVLTGIKASIFSRMPKFCESKLFP